MNQSKTLSSRPSGPRLRLLGVCLGALLVTGCAVGPDYRSPAGAMPAQDAFSGAANAALFIPEEPRGEWWRLYEEPTLDIVVAEALQANTDLRIAAANLARARAVLRENRSELFPDTTLSAGSTTGRQNLAGPSAVLEDTIYNAGLDISYQVDLFGQVRRAIEAASANAEAFQAAYDVTQITVAAETARAYANACSAGLQLAVAEDSLQLQTRSHELTQQLMEAGRGTAFEVASAAAQLAQTRAEIPSIRARHRAALLRLAVLMGRPPSLYPTEVVDCIDPPTLSNPLPVGDGASLLSRRPDVRQAERELASATATLGFSIASLYPNITLGANASAIALSVGDLAEDEAFRWSIGPLISWSFPNQLAARAAIAQAEASVAAALAQFDGTWLTALQEAETALSNYANQLNRVESLRSAREHSADAARLANARFDAGQISFLDVLQTELALVNAEMALAQSEARISDLQINLFLALGGGWGEQE